jgi:hypothetical protein
MNLILDLQGYTNHNVVRCIYDKSPLEFYANVKDDKILNSQIQILKFAWPNITSKIFLEHVCSSNLEKRVWINREELIPDHSLKLFIKNVNIEDINKVLNYSLGNKNVNSFQEAEDFFKNNITYPTIAIDFFPLLLQKCDPHEFGLQNNILYYLMNPPSFKT